MTDQKTAGYLAAIDKPVGMTSHDVVNAVRRALGVKRVGHAGTLDPLASGVMVMGVGQATRLLGFATTEGKSYRARVVFGSETTTDDEEGQTTVEAPAPEGALDRAWADAALECVRTQTMQVPPAYSAIQVDGRRAYAEARAGKAVELEPRPIRVERAELADLGTLDGGGVWWDVDFDVSKGTYIRALARDLGRFLGSACHLGGLRRLKSGIVTISDCASLDDVRARGADALRPLDPCAVLGIRRIVVDEGELADVLSGRRLSAARAAGGAGSTMSEGEAACIVHGDVLWGIAYRSGGALAPRVVFTEGVLTRW